MIAALTHHHYKLIKICAKQKKRATTTKTIDVIFLNKFEISKTNRKSVQLKSDKNNSSITRIVEANRNNKTSYCNIFSDQTDILACIKILVNSSLFLCTIPFKLVEIRIETIDFH